MRQSILKQHKLDSLRHVSGSLKFHTVHSFKWKTPRSSHGRMSKVMFDLLLAAILAVASFLQVAAQTKPNFAEGKSAGSYSLSNFDAVNLYNGNLSFNLPLLIVGGRGQTGYTMGLNINSLHWKVESDSVGGGGTEHICVFNNCDPKYIVTVTNSTVYETSFYTCVGSNPCIYSGSTFAQIDSTIILDGSPLLGEGGLAPEFTYYNVSPSDIQKVNPGYGPGVVRALTDKKWSRTFRGTLGPGSALTRIVFTAPDGSEYQLVDDQTNGQVRSGGATGGFPFNRGRNFHSIDGSAMTFISDADIIENFGGYVPGPVIQNPSGYLLFSDGARYRVVNGLIVWIRDRNGNQTNFSYDGNRRVSVVTDSLGRTATVDYGISGGGTSTYDRIKYSVSGEVDRYVKIWKDSLQNSLYGNEQIGTYGSLFSQYEQDPTNAGTIYNPSGMVNSVELPDGRRYEIRYNSYGEIAAVILPTGGKTEYDYRPVYSALGVARRVSERRVFRSSADTIPELTVKYTAGFQGGVSQQPETHVTVERKQGDTLLSKTKHYFYGNATDAQLGLYSPWKDGREYKTETFAADGGTVLRSVEMTWKPKAFFSWYNNGEEGDKAPADSPRVVEAKTALLDVSPALVRKTTSINPDNPNEIGFDQFNNPTDVWDYDFGPDGPGQLLRHTHTDYLATSPVNGIDYTTNDVHTRRLPAGGKVYGYKNGQEVLLSRSEFRYDETPLEPRGNVVGWTDPQTSARGLVTTAKAWIDTTDASVDQNSPQAYIQTQAKYDVLGNAVETTDGRGKKSYIYYDDNFGVADDEARQNNPPSRLNGQSTFAFATKVTNAPGHTVYAQFNYFTGATVNAEDANGGVSSVAYDDALGRPTKRILARYKVGSGVPAERSQTTITYDDANRVITVTSDLGAFEDNVLTSKYYYDGLGRTWRNAAREGDTWAITDKRFDALGRVSQVSNPYRVANPGSASPPSGGWTTTDYDALGRVTGVTTPDGARVDTAYSGKQVTVTDQAGKSRRTETDAFGRLINVIEDPLGLKYRTDYTYDALGNLRLVTQGAQARTFVYDSLSRLTSAANPESGTMTYAYDPNGNLVEKTDARGVKTMMTYDALNRVRSKVYSGLTPEGTAAANATPSVNYFYDDCSGLPSGAPCWPGTPSKGRLVGVTYGAGSEGTYYKYDAAGRIATNHQRQGTSNYVTTYTYNRAGAVTVEARGSSVRRRNLMTYDAGSRSWTPAFFQAPVAILAGWLAK
jgi:YD repeat-containing protein